MYQALDLVAADRAVLMPAYAGETLIMKGQPCEQTLEIRSGIARAVNYSSDGDRQVMAFFFPGDFVGLPLSPMHRYSVEAVNAVRYVCHGRQSFAPMVSPREERSNDVARAIWREEKAFIARGLVLGHVGIKARLAAFLGHLLSYLPKVDDTFDFGIPQSDIASYLATSPETVCRTLRCFRDAGIIAMPRKDRLRVLDEPRLHLMAGASDH